MAVEAATLEMILPCAIDRDTGDYRISKLLIVRSGAAFEGGVITIGDAAWMNPVPYWRAARGSGSTGGS